MAEIRGVISSIVAGDRQPREGVLVSIVQSDQSFPDLVAVTNESGEFALYNLLPGHYTVAIGDTRVDVTIRDANESVRLDVAFPERA